MYGLREEIEISLNVSHGSPHPDEPDNPVREVVHATCSQAEGSRVAPCRPPFLKNCPSEGVVRRHGCHQGVDGKVDDLIPHWQSNLRNDINQGGVVLATNLQVTHMEHKHRSDS